MLPFLLTGGSGRLGSAIRSTSLPLLSPSRKELDITSSTSINSYFSTHDFQGIIHCAAIARMAICEQNPTLAIETNIGGTMRLVEASMKKQNVRFVQISTDGVYSGTSGNYKEDGPTIPYNLYGWTKLGAECVVRTLPNHCIIRTSFFDPQKIQFDTAATDAYSSRLPITDIANAISRLATHTFRGTINVGGKRMSEYERYKEYKPSIQPCMLADIRKQAGSALSQDASLDCTVWQKIGGV